jgi:phytoene dehydrogenase-like protein
MAHNLYAIQTDAAGDAHDVIYVQLRPSELPGQNLLSLLTSGHEDLWQPWEQTVSGRRGGEYQQAKMDFAGRLIARAEKLIGPLGAVRLLDVSTPLTIRDWVASPGGSTYGVMRSTEQMLSAALLNRTSLRGLYFAGQSVWPRILGTILGSLATVQFIVARSASAGSGPSGEARSLPDLHLPH